MGKKKKKNKEGENRVAKPAEESNGTEEVPKEEKRKNKKNKKSGGGGTAVSIPPLDQETDSLTLKVNGQSKFAFYVTTLPGKGRSAIAKKDLAPGTDLLKEVNKKKDLSQPT